MALMQEITCECGCGRKRIVRASDIKRGWGRFFNKSCKARHQERKTKQYKKFLNRELENEIGHLMASGVDGHGQE